MMSCQFPLADAMTSGVWAEMSMLGDPELHWLAKSLPSVVLGSCADSTVAKYGYTFQRWKAWVEHRSVVAVFPLGEVHFALSGPYALGVPL